MAVNSCDLKMIEKLVKSGDLNINSVLPCDQYREISVLQFAIMNSGEELIDFLLNKNVELNISTVFLGTALHVAIKEKNLEVVKKLVFSGADVNVRPSHYERLPPLHRAIQCGDYEITKFLVMSGANVSVSAYKEASIAGCYHWSPLNIAISKKDIRVIQLLLKNNATIDQGSYGVKSSLHLAASTSSIEILQILENFGAKFNIIKDGEYTEEFEEAMRQDNIDIFKLFVKKCPNFLEISDLCGETVARQAIILGSKNILNYLLDCGVDINVVNNDDSSLLDIAMEMNIHLADLTFNQERQDPSSAMIKTIQDHIIKLSAAGEFVTEKYLKAVDGEHFQSFRDKCEKEIGEMKIQKIRNSNLSYFSVFKKNVHRLAVGLTNLDCINKDEILAEFPVYGSYIFEKLRRALDRKELLKNAEVLHDIFYMDLPSLVGCRMFLDYLFNRRQNGVRSNF
ncbi:hypothetical protein KQX54_012048 [Cotesia glomerata]|uniref:Uncharacterized protein n=1 Tax=Cotesia glomerata TaxID=32391 RepID=A0AAV7IXK4_COTGL|nr:hypothetical protein KQX54_012048 [Cotesia glomerata]